MATDTPESTDQAEDANLSDAKASRDGFWLKFAAIAGLLVIVMVVQFLMLYFLFGKSEEPEVDPADPSILDGEVLEDTKTTEMDITPTFNCTNSLSNQGQSLHVSFNLCVEVPSNLTEQFNEAKKAHKNRIRQQVITIIRSAALEDLNDPNLSMIKRQIREEINKILSQSYIRSVIITDYRKMEQ